MKTFVDRYLLKEWVIVVIAVLLFILVRSIFEDQHPLMKLTVVVLAAFKIGYFLLVTFRRIEKTLRHPCTYHQLLVSLGTLIVLMILSFSLDYTCLVDCDEQTFKGWSNEGLLFANFFQMTYFSMVTFATVGFGDMAPITYSAKILVMMEIASSFFMIVFIISNLYNIKAISDDNKNYNDE